MGGFTPSPITPIGVLVKGISSKCTPSCYRRFDRYSYSWNLWYMGGVQQTSTTVLVGGIGVCRLMDKGNCGAMILGTAATVIAGG